MTDDNGDRFSNRLSEYLDGDLEPAESSDVERHVALCADCRATLAGLRALAESLPALRDREPRRDLWPGIAGEIGAAPSARRPWVRHALRAAAASLLAVASFAAGRFFPAAAQDVPSPPARFMLLLREPPGHLASATPSERAAIVDRYRAWARSLLPSRTMLDGAKLDDGFGLSLRPGGEATPLDGAANGHEIGGFFVIGARDEAEALATARTCPHLEQGGWIEVRRFEAR